mmetsp:Transcript_61289/g.121327  ORF Transcript_61289/g.121327 Transcript_61289/m.121327 type:complete len:440 (-) Transcript_61289:3-1322(-)
MQTKGLHAIISSSKSSSKFTRQLSLAGVRLPQDHSKIATLIFVKFIGRTAVSSAVVADDCQITFFPGDRNPILLIALIPEFLFRPGHNLAIPKVQLQRTLPMGKIFQSWPGLEPSIVISNGSIHCVAVIVWVILKRINKVFRYHVTSEYGGVLPLNLKTFAAHDGFCFILVLSSCGGLPVVVHDACVKTVIHEKLPVRQLTDVATTFVDQLLAEFAVHQHVCRTHILRDECCPLHGILGCLESPKCDPLTGGVYVGHLMVVEDVCLSWRPGVVDVFFNGHSKISSTFIVTVLMIHQDFGNRIEFFTRRHLGVDQMNSANLGKDLVHVFTQDLCVPEVHVGSNVTISSSGGENLLEVILRHVNLKLLIWNSRFARPKFMLQGSGVFIPWTWPVEVSLLQRTGSRETAASYAPEGGGVGTSQLRQHSTEGDQSQMDPTSLT